MHDHTVQICEIEKRYHHEFVLEKDDDEEKRKKKHWNFFFMLMNMLHSSIKLWDIKRYY